MTMSGVGLHGERNLVVKSGLSQLSMCPEVMELPGFCSLPSFSAKLVAQFLWKCFILFVHSDGLCPVEAFTWGDYRHQEVQNNWCLACGTEGKWSSTSFLQAAGLWHRDVGQSASCEVSSALLNERLSSAASVHLCGSLEMLSREGGETPRRLFPAAWPTEQCL